MTSPRRERTSFVGRAAELAAIRAAFERGARLVTVHGPPGVGKTRLTRAFTSAAADRTIVRVDLSSSRSPDDWVRAIGRAVGLHDTEGEAALARMPELLAARGTGAEPTLLVLDPLEGLAAAAAPILASWVDAVDTLDVLVASRERLRVEGEITVGVGPLPLDDAARLFVERARAVRPTLPADADADPHVRRLVERVDRLPLAIEIAAARASILSPREILERSERDGPLGGDPDAVLRRALEWSWSLLGERERRALAQCSVFVSGFAPEAAERVLDLGAHGGDAQGALSVLDALVASALMVARDEDSGTRLEVYETVRAFAAEHLPTLDPHGETELRHARWLAELDRDAPKGHAGIDARPVLARVARERDDLVAAFRRMRARGERAHAEVVALARVLDPLLVMEGPLALHVEVLETAIEASRALGDDGSTIDLLRAKGRVHGLRGDGASAEPVMREALALARARGDAARTISLLTVIAHVVAPTGRVEEARALAAEARERARALDDPRAEAFTEQTLGIVARVAGELDEATARFRSAAAIARRARADRPLALALGNLGESSFARGDLDDASAALAECRALFEAIGDRLHVVRVAPTEIALLVARGDLQAAAQRLEEARALAAPLVTPLDDASLLVAEGRLALARGDRLAAKYARDGARTLAARLADRLLAAELDALDRALDRALHDRGAGDEAPLRLAIADDARAFRVAADAIVDLSRRATLARVLRSLVARRRETPGRGLDPSALFEAAWPGERAQPSSAAARVYMAVRALRGLGLARVIETREDGYRIDPRVPLETLDFRGV